MEDKAQERLRLAVARVLDEELSDTLAPAYQALDAIARELDEREALLEAREREVALFMDELERMGADLLQGDTAACYRLPDAEEQEGVLWVDPASLPPRELSILRVMQLTAEKTLRDQGHAHPRKACVLSIEGSNTELVEQFEAQIPGLNSSALSACLTRMRHRGMVAVTTKRDVRHIILKMRLAAP